MDYNCKNINVIDENIPLDKANIMLIIAPVETFFTQYQIYHLYYIYLFKTNNPDIQKFKDYLLKKYHSDDEKIFSSRFRKKIMYNLLMSERKLFI